MEPVPSNHRQRASDADRDAVVEVLQVAMADGRLDGEEFEERMGLAYQAKTLGDLAPLTDDLGGHVMPAASPASVKDELVLGPGSGMAITKEGQWTVPRRTVVRGRASGIRLDLTEATVLTPEVEISLDVDSSSVTVIVPDDVVVDAAELNVDMGAAQVRTVPSASPAYRVRITGRCAMSAVKVRHLTAGERRRRRRRDKRAGRRG